MCCKINFFINIETLIAINLNIISNLFANQFFH